MCVRFLFHLRHPFSSPPLPSSSSSCSGPRRRAFYRRRRRAAHSQHDSACWPPSPALGGSFSLNPAALHPPRLRPQAHEHAGLLAAQHRLQTPRSSVLSTSLRRRKFGSAPPSHLRCSGSAGAPARRPLHPSAPESGAARALLSHAAVLQR